jgi:N6-adenosine-specific RNA methylase IME4
MKKYQIIYADPPWSYNVASKKGTSRGVAERYYPVMKPKDIEKLPIGELADNAVLFLWATYPNLETALNVIREWGFTFKTVAFTWVKIYKHTKNPVMGCGFWTRANAEICLLATKGKEYPRRINKGVQQVIIEPQREHSRKPDIARERILQLMGDLPRIELFAREKTEGWTSIGYDIDGKDISESIKLLAQ